MLEILNNSMVVAVIGIMSAIIGYGYRARKENLKNRKLALFYLLEIWFRLSVFYKKSYDKEFEVLFVEIKKLIPNFNPSEEESAEVKESITPIIFQQSVKSSLSDYEGALNKLEKSIELLAQENPIIAYKLNTARDIFKAQEYLDGYLAEINKCEILDDVISQKVITTEQIQDLQITVKHHQLLEITKNIEKNIINLAFHLSIFTLIQTMNVIHYRKRIINEVDAEQAKIIKKMALSLVSAMSNNHNLTKT
nr:hypothetical protein [uncultured Tolumonas sp.]